MKTNRLLVAVSAAGLLAAGCATTVPAPQVAYPVTYQIPVGNTNVRAVNGPQDLAVAATQRVSVEPGDPLYYRIASPVDVTVQIYQLLPSGSRTLLTQVQGSNITNAMRPTTPALDFVFQAAQPNSNGTLTFTISDEPIAAAVTTTTVP